MQPLTASFLSKKALQIIDRYRHEPAAKLPDGRPDLRYLDARFTEALHARYTRETTGGQGHDLSGYYVTDEDMRSRWRGLDLQLQSAALRSSALVHELLTALIAGGGDALETLRQRRARLDQQIQQLERGRVA